jgi:hypothetical protein
MTEYNTEQGACRFKQVCSVAESEPNHFGGSRVEIITRCGLGSSSESYMRHIKL